MGRWNAGLHPRDSRGRFRAKYIKGSLAKNSYVGKGGKYHGVKVGGAFKTADGGEVLIKGIVGYAPPKKRQSS